MPPDITGLGGAAGVPIPPTAPVRPAAPSRALVPVERVGPRAPTASPLDRSGVALEDLLFAPDVLESRDAATPVAMEMGLETARRQLLQRQPAESLATLDAVWGRAEGSEEGWYLRAGALTVLGHPQEGDAVAREGLETQPQSLALRLVQSVARALVGDLSGARAALYLALDAAPDDPVLLAQQAVVLARQGHTDDAAELLQQITDATPEHPALAWARTTIRTASTDRTRSAARVVFIDDDMPDLESIVKPTGQPVMPPDTEPMSESITARIAQPIAEPIAEPVTVPPAEPMAESAAEAMAAPMPEAGDEPVEAVAAGAPEPAGGDLVATAFRELGETLRTAPDDTLSNTARMLLRACSAGGTLASTCTPAEAHAARQVLSALLLAMRPDGIGAAVPGIEASPLSSLMTQLLPLLRDQSVTQAPLNVADAERMLRRLGPSVPPEVRRVLTVLVEGADGTARRPEAAGAVGSLFPDEVELGPLVPIRLGLSLLAETAATRALERQQEIIGAGIGMASGVPLGAVYVPTTDVRRQEPVLAELSGTGWGAAAAAGEATEGARRPRRDGAGAAFPAILLVAAAVGAALNGAGTIAVLLGGVGLWLALRSRGQSRRD